MVSPASERHDAGILGPGDQLGARPVEVLRQSGQLLSPVASPLRSKFLAEVKAAYHKIGGHVVALKALCRARRTMLVIICAKRLSAVPVKTSSSVYSMIAPLHVSPRTSSSTCDLPVPDTALTAVRT